MKQMKLIEHSKNIDNMQSVKCTCPTSMLWTVATIAVHAIPRTHTHTFFVCLTIISNTHIICENVYISERFVKTMSELQHVPGGWEEERKDTEEKQDNNSIFSGRNSWHMPIIQSADKTCLFGRRMPSGMGGYIFLLHAHTHLDFTVHS